ncbi:YdcH family protein [Erythrobacter longus]|uniref:YdcH family protein n=1 Tax=Erythrobacter longus TaxID=1044 RepID=UPI000552C69C|nr:YdcH family protein [Erythrobacter longus]
MATAHSSGAASSHVNALQSKHAGLEARLRDEMARPVPDAAAVQAIKRQKLKIKEEIARC